MQSFDVITFGEALLRLSPPDGQMLIQADKLDMHIGGTELNTAVGTARLGLQTAWVSRLPRHAVGERVVREAAGYGVDPSHVVWTDAGRVGLYYYQAGHGVRPADVIYDRQHTPICDITPADIPAAWFERVRARLFHTTGITLAISQQAAETARYLAEQAKAHGWQVSFDVNYRSKLWTPEEAARACEPLMQLADVIFIPYRDAVLLTGHDGGYESLPQALRRQYPNAVIVMTLGEDGALALTPEGRQHRHVAYHAPELDRIGRGDAFDAGFLYGYLSSEKDAVHNGLRYGTAAAAYKQSVPGDLPLLDRNALDRLVNEQPDTPFR